MTDLRAFIRPSRARLAKRWGWDDETQRLVLLHAADPAVRFDADFEGRIRRFVGARS